MPADQRSIIMFFDSFAELARVALTALLAYLALILFLRVGGKRLLAKLNAFDLIVTIALGSMLASTLLSKDVALAEGMVGLALLLGLQYALSASSVRFPWLKQLVRSEPALLARNGKLIEEALRRERITRGEAMAAVRQAGVARLEEVAALVLETDGSFSVIEGDEADELTVLEDVRQP